MLKAQPVQHRWFLEEEDEVNCPYEDCKFAASLKGWTSNLIALEWLNRIFFSLTRSKDPEQWRIIVLDGHGSHTDSKFILSCFDNKVLLIDEPPHSSHILQPLDVGRFLVLKRRFRRDLDKACGVSNDSHVRKGDFLRAWAFAREQALTEKVIKGGYSATGIFPRDIPSRRRTGSGGSGLSSPSMRPARPWRLARTRNRPPKGSRPLRIAGSEEEACSGGR
ncbi:hypothetical protein PG984_012796 [Apiospora sp. TS-2023a]